MSRLFDGINDRITFAPGNIANIHTGAQTYAYLIKLNAVHRGGMFDGLDAGSARRVGINPFDSGVGDVFYNITGQGFQSFSYGSVVNIWAIIAITKAAGSAVPRAHIYNYNTATWTHSALGGALGNGATALASFIIGSFDLGQWLSANLAATGYWNSALADATFDSSSMPTSFAGWAALNPNALHRYNQALATDPVPDVTGGGADSTLVEGTTIVGVDPPGFSYALSANGVLGATVSAATLAVTGSAADTGVLGGAAQPATLRLTGDSAVADCDWPVDPGCVPEWSTYTETVRSNAIAWSSYIMKSLTGNRFSLCSVTVRPCYQRCDRRTYETFGVWMDSPYGQGGSWVPFQDFNGEWRNCGGGCFGICCCGASCEVWLPGPIGEITEVRIDNAVVPASAYRVDNRELLVRQDGNCWPECANLNVAADSTDNTFVVTYTRGETVPRAGEIAAGILAGEFAKACVGAACAIPERVTSVSRSGVQFQLVSPTDEFNDGLTGITEVDRFIRAANPYKLKARPWVSSPDLPVPRMQTWP